MDAVRGVSPICTHHTRGSHPAGARYQRWTVPTTQAGRARIGSNEGFGASPTMKVLAIDVGGTHVKMLATDQKVPRKLISGPKMTATQMVSAVQKLAAAWKYDVVSIGYPGPVVHGRIIHEPYNLGS